MFTPATIKITVLRSDVNKAGDVFVYLQFIRNRKSHRFSLKKSIPLKLWQNIPPNYVSNKHPNAKHLNAYLNDQYSKAEKILLKAEDDDEYLTFEEFKRRMQGGKHRNDLFNDVYLNFVQRKRKEGVQETTIEEYGYKTDKILKYAPNLRVREMDEEWVREFVAYLRTNEGLAHNTIYKYIVHIRGILDLAVRQKLISPEMLIWDLKMSYIDPYPTQLTELELDKLQRTYGADILKHHLQNVLHYFLFACYTGLGFQDIEQLNYTNIQQSKKGYYIQKERVKRNKEDTYIYTVPLLPQALCLIDITAEEGPVFYKIISNQKTNEALKEIASVVGIKKNLNFLVARHTFGTIAVNKGIPRAFVQKAMGHRRSQMTDHYAKLESDILIESFEDKWKKDG